MKASSVHLNLLKPGELRSSSPIRLRVMLPIGAILACAGLLLWWGMLFTQLLMTKAQAQGIAGDIAAKEKEHAEAIQQRDLARELKLQLEQLDYYKAGVRSVGDDLSKLAEVVPLRVQLKELHFSPPKAQILQPPGAKIPLFGPTENVETQKLVIAGLTTKETPVVSLMESLETGFEGLITRERKINSFKQDAAEAEGRKLLSFEIEYTMPERRFAK
jgi:hypothetical protein